MSVFFSIDIYEAQLWKILHLLRTFLIKNLDNKQRTTLYTAYGNDVQQIEKLNFLQL